jgi:pyruvate-formate lyase
MQFFGARVNLAKALLYAITAAVTSSPANRSVPPARR